ncbi:hypothetical protein [Ktedonobacter racemifer]|uniref:Uncharacterized protein n=1 Tax=Ktedonobacter racemifer DSM 44963 TaxID=485913 RepID=D6TGT9_KTERA|nr:hypothetical protein [Ktedonobacter racemifer]EFH88868.1 hypothetical protein Krac_10373 [Ktedonobacter racemifer DSM 44963]
MHERKKKPTLEQIRTLFPFDVPDLARAAGVETSIVYQALLLRPVHRQDAEKILHGLSNCTKLTLTLENIDMMLWEEYLTLWLLRASASEQQQEGGEREGTDAYHFVYARDELEAQFRTQTWLAQHPHLPNHTFTSCPNGFQIGPLRVPGICPDELVCTEAFPYPF